MKKSLLTFLVAFCALSAFAQLTGGLKAGLNLANFSGDVEGNSMRIGFHAGAYATFNLSDKIGLQPELLYNSVGSTIDSDGTDVDFVMNYISIPVMLLYNASENFNIQVGPQFGFLASADGKAEGASVDIKDFFKGSDLGLNIGIGLNFGKLNANARYCLGLSNIAEDSGDDKVTNSVIQVGIGYRLLGGE